VTIASQRRYINYYADILKQGMPAPRPVVMQSIHITLQKTVDLVIAVYQRDEATSELKLLCCNIPSRTSKEATATVRIYTLFLYMFHVFLLCISHSVYRCFAKLVQLGGCWRL